MLVEIKKLFEIRKGRYLPCGLNIVEQLWWRFVPGVVISVKWPVGWVVLYENPDGSRVSAESADPNDHYRPEITAKCGRQKWDWDWGMADRDATDNRLTIKFRRKHAMWASYFALKWG